MGAAPIVRVGSGMYLGMAASCVIVAFGLTIVIAGGGGVGGGGPPRPTDPGFGAEPR
jgi:hypothetical protein